MVIHVVQRGDTLWAISQTYGVPINQIIAANELESPNNLVIGLALVIPTSYIVHIVRSGETLWQIANQYNVPIQSIIGANQIANPAQINVGTRLTIPPSNPHSSSWRNFMVNCEPIPSATSRAHSPK